MSNMATDTSLEGTGQDFGQYDGVASSEVPSLNTSSTATQTVGAHTTQQDQENAPETTGSVHRDNETRVEWRIDNLRDPSVKQDSDKLSNGWRYKFDFTGEKGTLSISNGMHKLEYTDISKKYKPKGESEDIDTLTEIKNLLLKMHEKPSPHLTCKDLMELVTKKCKAKFDVTEDENMDLMETLGTELTSVLNIINREALVKGNDKLRVKNGLKDEDDANALAYKSVESSISKDEIKKNPSLFYTSCMDIPNRPALAPHIERPPITRKITIEKLHGDKEKEDQCYAGNWDSITLEQKNGELLATVNAQSHIGRKTNFAERRFWNVQRFIEDQIVNRIERLVGGFVPKFIGRTYNKYFPDTPASSVTNAIVKASPYVAFAAVAMVGIAYLPVVLPYATTALSYASTGWSMAAPYVSSALSWVGSALAPVTTPLAPYATAASGWFTSTFPGVAASLPSYSTLSTVMGGAMQGAFGAITSPVGMFVTSFLFTTRLGAKFFGQVGKLCTKFTRTKPTKVTFKVADLKVTDGECDLDDHDGRKVVEKVEKILKALSEDKVTEVPKASKRFWQAATEKHVEHNTDTISRSNLIDKMLGDENMTLREIKHAELNNLNWLAMGEHPGLVLEECRSMNSNFYFFKAHLKQCEFYGSKIVTGSETEQGVIKIDQGFYDATTFFTGRGSSWEFVAPSFFTSINPFVRSLRFQADVTQVESMEILDFCIAPPQWYHPLQYLNFLTCYGGMKIKKDQVPDLYKSLNDEDETIEERDRRITRDGGYMSCAEFLASFSNPWIMPGMTVDPYNPNKVTDALTKVFQLDVNGYFLEIEKILDKSSEGEANYASVLTKKYVLNKQWLNDNGRPKRSRHLVAGV